MKKLKNLIALMLCLMSVGILASCDNTDKYKVAFTQDSITLEVGQAVNLEELVVLEVAKIENVAFKSSDSSVVYIKPNNEFETLKNGIAVIEAKTGNSLAYLTVTVSSPLQKFPGINNLFFDNNTGRVHWTHPYIIKNSVTILASSYTLTIEKGGDTETKTTQNNYYEFTSAGTYKVSVSASLEGYAKSDSSTEIEFTVLNAPKNVTYNKETSVLSWDNTEGYEYIVFFDEYSTQVQTNSIVLPFTQSGEHKVKVRAKVGSNFSRNSDELTITRLTSPQVTIREGVLNFDISQAAITSKYIIAIEDAYGEQFEVENSSGQYLLEGFNANTYYLKVYALSKGALVLDSLNPQTYEVEKLQSPTLQFDKATKQISVLHANATVEIINKITQEKETFDLGAELSLTLDKNNGLYEIYAYYKSRQNNQIKSDNSNHINVKILSSVTQLRHISEDDVSTVSFSGVQGAEGYNILINGVSQEYNFSQTPNLLLFTLTKSTGELFNADGTYVLTVEAFDSEFENQVVDNHEFYLIANNSANETVNITRLAQVGVAKENQIITWGEIALAEGYAYKLYKNDELIAESTTALLSLSVANQTFGNYHFEIKALGNNRTVLESLSNSVINFQIKETLQTPGFAFDRTTKELVVTAVANADEYIITFQSLPYETLTDELRLFIGDEFVNVGLYEFSVVAVSASNSADNDGDGNLFSSSPANVAIEKLPVLTSFTITNQLFAFDLSDDILQVLSPHIARVVFAGKVITSINDIENFDTLDHFSLAVKLLANTTLTSPYYLDSDFSSFNFERIATPDSLHYENGVISWEESDVENYKLFIKAGLNTYEFTLSENQKQISDFSELSFYQSLLTGGFSFAVLVQIDEVSADNAVINYISSKLSNYYAVGVLGVPEITGITFDDDLLQNEITIEWNAVENADGYVVTFQNVDYNISETSYTFAKQTGISSYSFKVKAVSQTYLQSGQASLSFEKVNKPSGINIDVYENVTLANFPTTVENILFDGLVYDNNVFSLNAISNSGTLEIMFEAIGLDGGIYYLNSEKSIFTFERLAKVQNVEVINNEIVWEIEPLAEKYEIKLINSLNETKIITIAAKTGLANYISSLPLIDNEILLFTANSGIYSLTVRALILGYSLDLNNSHGYLSGLASDVTNFGKLETVSGINVLADETDEQTWITINFNAVPYAQSYDIYLNGNLFKTVYTNSLYTDELTYSGAMSVAGSYEIKIIANSENYISSSLSEGYTVKRLPAVSQASLTVNDNGRFSWIGVSNNSGYKVYYKRAGESPSDVYFAPSVYYDFSSLLTVDEFSGYIDFYVLVAGNGTTTLSSVYVYSTKVRIDKPEFNIYGSYMQITKSTLWPVANYRVTVKFDNGTTTVELRNFTLRAEEKYQFPDVWTYQNNPVSESGTYIFEVFAYYDDSIFSPTATATRLKLQSVTMLGFTKLSGIDQSVVLRADATNLSGVDNVDYTLKVDATGYTYSQITPDSNNILIYPVSGDLDFYINSGNFKIDIQATREGYLDSRKTTISGYRLSAVSRLDGSGGILNWETNTHTEVSGYLLRVLHSEDVYDKIIKSRNSNNDELTGIRGNIVANIKVIGNLEVNVPKLTNIVLDSTFILEGYILQNQTYLREKNFTANKLATPDSFDILIGEFKIAIVEGATSYVAKDQFGRIFPLQTAIYEDQFAVGLSDSFYSGVNKLNLNTTYTMKVRAVSSAENVLYSDYTSSTQNIRVMPNPNTTENDMTFTWATSHINSVVINWQSSSISNNYIYELVAINGDGGSIIKNTYYDAVVGSNTLTLNMDDYPLSGNYYFKIKVLGKFFPEIGGYYYISSAYSPALEFVKLRDPKVEVKNGRLSWDTVSGANGYYIYYTVKNSDDMVLSSFITLYTEYPYMQNQLFWNAPTGFGSLDESLTYYFGVRAVNTETTMKLAPSSIGAVYDYIIQAGEEDEEEIIEIEYLDTLRAVTKLESPNELQLIDGKLVWKAPGLNYNYTINYLNFTATLNGGNKPFVYKNDIDELEDLEIVIRLRDVNGVERKYTVSAIKFFHATVVDSPLFAVVSEMLGLSADFEFGWPVLNWFTNEIGAAVVPGLQSMSVSQKGNDYDWLDSNFTTGYDVYIAHAPVTRISNYVLSWDPVSLPVGTHPYSATNKYTIVAQNEAGVRKYIHQTNTLSVDLRDLVNSGMLASGRHQIYVMVTGDSSTYLYGLPSEAVDVLVLPTVNASLAGGIIDWATISQAVTYNVIMDPNNINYRFEGTMNAGPWDFSQIAIRNALGELLTYRLTIQAIGNGTTVISGKVTDMGLITKLDTPAMSVSQGVLVWANITNNNGYEMIIRRDGTKLSSTILSVDRVFFESKTTGFNNYNLRAVGTTGGYLNAMSQSYAISSESENGIDAVMLDSIGTVRAHEGKMLWTNIREKNNTSVSGYKITFDDRNFYDPVFVFNFSPIIIGGESYVIYEIDSSYLAGEYKIYVQAYSVNTYLRTQDGKTYSYLLGGIQQSSSVEFVKLRNVSNISTQNGVLIWDDNESLSDTFKVTFTRAAQQVVFYTNTNRFDPATLSKEDEALYKTLLTGEQYSVKIQTIGNNFDLINSDEIESLGYTKLPTISNVEYLIDDSGQEGFIIRWLFTNYVQEITDYHYIIRYSNSNDPTEVFTLDSRESNAIRRGYLESRNCYFGEIDGSLLMREDTEQLSFSILVVPITSVLMLTSDFSTVRSVTPPTSLSGMFTYIESSRKIAWEYDAGGTDVSFRIIDEIISLGANNEITVLETRTYTSQVKEFYPELIGIHRISISVMLTGEQVASSYVYFRYSTAQTGIINDSSFKVENNGEELSFTLLNFNLFESGDGTETTPYIISTQSHFENINQRLTKPSYMSGSMFHFKQSANLVMTLSSPIGNFNGVYDGNAKQITWQMTNTSSTKVALFTSLEPNAVIKNVIVNAKIIQSEDLTISTVYLSSLVADNYGTIQNSQVKSFAFETSMSRGIEYYYGSFAAVNYGIITQSVNTANINFDGLSTQLSIRNSKVFVGGVAYINSKTTKGGVTYIGTITQTGNTGTITVVANSLTIGGLVATTDVDAIITQSYNKGSIYATLTATATTLNYIGGLVAYNRGVIRNSYNASGVITANMSSYNRTIYIGGLAGYITGAKGAIISNSFTITTNITTTNNSQANVSMALMVGYSNASTTSLQTTSYYTNFAGLSAINNAPSGFNIATIGTYASLLNNLNLADYVFSQGATYPRLTWELSFVII